MINDLRKELKSSKDEFCSYRLSNDIDFLFGQSLDFQKRRTLLSEVKELMKESDWHVYSREQVLNTEPAMT
jgi:hypothetical protein